MNDMLDLLKSRRSVAPHLMSGPGPDAAELETLLTIASRVPDHGKLAPWRFIVIEGEARHRLGKLIGTLHASLHPDAKPETTEIERGRLARAPLVIAVISTAGPHVKIPEWEQILSAGAVCMNLTIAANAMGFVTAWLTEWFGYHRDFLDALGVRETERLAGFVHIGRAAEKPQDRPRPQLDEIVTRLTF